MKSIFDAKISLYRIVKYLNERGENLEDPTKRSHENKCLLQHVMECWNITDGILEKLGLFEDKIRRFCFSLCVVHDIGKLDLRWQLKKKKKLKHAKRSGELLWRIEKELTRLLPLPDNYQEPLIFAVLKHHSPLHIWTTKDEIRLERAIRSFFMANGKLDVSLAITIADAIGVFKLADMISASESVSPNLVFQQYEWPRNFDRKIVNGIKHGAKKKRRSFDSRKYKLQEEIAYSAHKHLALIAPTGWGKTALGLLRIKSIKPNKVFYILPTITAIREFKENLENIFGSNYIGEYFYFSDVEDLIRLRGMPEERTVYPTSFYRYFVPKVMITTIDQLLLAALQFGKYHLRRFNFINSLLILDEFHLLTPEMVGALKAIFENLAGVYDFSVLLMSATPSTLYISILKEALGKEDIDVHVLKSEYEHLKRHNIRYIETNLLDFVQEKKDMFKEKRVLVISNAVDKAVQIYDILQKKIKNRKICLIHGRFAYKDRAKSEDEAKNADILVSTQVAEVSLDISYNILVTEFAPVPSLIQRFGRVNRYNSDCIKEKNVYICQTESEKPYLSVELIATEEIFPKLEKKLQEEGEKMYLEILNEYHEKLPGDYVQKIERMYKWTNKVLYRSKFFYYLKNEDPSIFGREPSCLAVPYCYHDKVRQLKERMRGKNFEERKKLMACMKKHFISVPLYIINEESEWDEDLYLFVVGGKKYIYNPKMGLLKF